VLPKLLKKLVQRRRQVKSIIKTCKDPAELISVSINCQNLEIYYIFKVNNKYKIIL